MRRDPGHRWHSPSAAALLLNALLALLTAPDATAAATPSDIEGIAVGADLRTGNFNLHYRSVGTARAALALWIHGTPGGWSDIGGLMRDQTFTDRVRLVAVDRPGWGASQFLDDQRMAPTFAEHGQLLRPLLEQLQQAHQEVPLIVAGHSWGAPMVASLGADHPDLVDGVVALAGPFDPSIRILRWYNYAGAWPGIRTLIGATLRNSNEEMFQLRAEVRAAQEAWRALQVPIAIIQGMDDRLVPIAHLDHAEQLFRSDLLQVLRVPEQGHLLQFERTQLIGRCILALAGARPADCRVDPARLD